MYLVYLIRCKTTRMLYVGYTGRDLASRWRDHVREAHKKRCYLHKAIHKYGPDVFAVSLLSRHILKSRATEAERRAISRLKTLSPNGYNLTLGGDGRVGVKHSKETRALLSRRLRERYTDPEQRKKTGAVWLGRKRSVEDKRRKSEAAKRAWARPGVRERQIAALKVAAKLRYTELVKQARYASQCALEKKRLLKEAA